MTFWWNELQEKLLFEMIKILFEIFKAFPQSGNNYVVTGIPPDQ